MADHKYQVTAAFVEGLAGMGLRHVCISPGSRNSPLAIPFAANAGITDWIHHDERSAAFFALGLARVTRTPVAVVTTSGTAAAELHPAVIEANLSRVPLLLLTADRPPELRDVGAPQAIDQTRIFGTSVRWFHEVAAPDAVPPGYAVHLAARAWTAATDSPPGPVHLNFPLREPLTPGEAVPASDTLPRPPAVLRGSLAPGPAVLENLATLVSGRRTLVVVGPQDQPGFPPVMAALAAAGRLPVLSDPLSQLRAGPHDRSLVITTGDVLARIGALDSRLRPEIVLRFGGPVTSKALTSWLAGHPEIQQVVVDEAGWRDPAGSISALVRSDPLVLAAGLTGAFEPAPADWAAAWTDAENRVRTALSSAVGFPTEPGIVIAVAEAVGNGTQLYVGSSMPIRDVDAFFPAVDRNIRILANRGANGIDGLVSSALGAAAAGVPTVVLAGDLSLLHDLTALGTAARFGLPVTIVVVDNDGGGIFHFLPQARFPEYFERLLGTPHGTDFEGITRGFGLEFRRVDRGETLRGLLGRPPGKPTVIVVRTDRHRNVDVHEAAWRAAAGS